MILDFSTIKFIDLTHPLTTQVPHWGVGCGFKHEIELDYQDCTENTKFRTYSLTMPAGIGTHIDAPRHCIPDALAIDQLPLAALIVPCCMLDVSARAHETFLLSVEDLMQFENQHGIIPAKSLFIVYTGWERHWHQPKQYRNDLRYPSVSVEAAGYLLKRGIVGLGIDTLSPDAGNSGFPVHQLLLSAGVYLIENVANAAALHATGDVVMTLPVSIQDGTEAPVRMVGIQRQPSS